ncbi:unnamed protein product [Vitrella brassicaformis CCMP3155]|uniref:Uncharacterized protein n=2 Tax=Vitrella brassicaformis TaxID=1169539 RepID=A0A0G4FNQ4_VITBC|nr:unnamed protein product [Vitrella brassicaformis CCMP3155]|eukprot:CEM15856.1 unnamed protein product [Vitrella brassicaformis CCMP3155]
MAFGLLVGEALVAGGILAASFVPEKTWRRLKERLGLLWRGLPEKVDKECQCPDVARRHSFPSSRGSPTGQVRAAPAVMQDGNTQTEGDAVVSGHQGVTAAGKKRLARLMIQRLRQEVRDVSNSVGVSRSRRPPAPEHQQQHPGRGGPISPAGSDTSSDQGPSASVQPPPTQPLANTLSSAFRDKFAATVGPPSLMSPLRGGVTPTGHRAAHMEAAHQPQAQPKILRSTQAAAAAGSGDSGTPELPLRRGWDAGGLRTPSSGGSEHGGTYMPPPPIPKVGIMPSGHSADPYGKFHVQPEIAAAAAAASSGDTGRSFFVPRRGWDGGGLRTPSSGGASEFEADGAGTRGGAAGADSLGLGLGGLPPWRHPQEYRPPQPSLGRIVHRGGSSGFDPQRVFWKPPRTTSSRKSGGGATS